MATELAKAYVQIVPSMEGIKGKLTEALGGEGEKSGKKGGESFGKSFGNALKSASSAVIKGYFAGVAAMATAAGKFALDSVKVGAEFDKSMSQVAATMGTTVDEIGELRDFALEMGSSTSFSASQSAEALNYMALAGYDTATSMKMLPNVLNLAAAGSIDLARASDMVTDAQSALGLDLDQTSDMVNMMAKASSKTNTSVEQLGDAFLTVGGTAKMLSGGTVELSTALGLLADNGIKGTEGGTALRNILLSLSSPTDTAAEKLKELGVSAFDAATGQMRPLEDVMGDLNTAMADMTDQQKAQALSTIFNKVDLKSVNALLATDAERWEEVTAAIMDSSGAAEAMANTQLDNLSGDVTLFKSALEGAQIVISDELSPELRKFVQFGTGAIGDLTAAFQEGGLAGAGEAFGKILSDGIGMITQMLPELINVGAQMLTALLTGLAQNTEQLASAAVSVISTLVLSLINNLPMVIQFAADMVVQLANGLAEAAPSLIPAVITGLVQIGISLIENLPIVIEAIFNCMLAIGAELRGMLGQLWTDYIWPWLSDVFSSVGEWFSGIISSIGEWFSGIFSSIGQFFSNAWQTISQWFVNIIQKVVGFFSNIWQKYNETRSNVLSAVGQFFSNIWQSITSWFSRMIQKVVTFVTSIPQKIRDGFSRVTQAGLDLVKGLWNGISNATQWVLDKIRGFGKSILNGIKKIFGIGSPSKEMAYFGEMLDAGLAQGIEGNTRPISNAIDDITSMTTKGFGADLGVNTSMDVNHTSAGMAQLVQLVAALSDKIDKLQVYLDGDLLVGGISDRMDTALGANNGRKARGLA